MLGSREQGAETFYRQSEPIKKLYGAGAVKPYLLRAGKNPLELLLGAG